MDSVLFAIDNGKLDDVFLDKFDSGLDYEEIKGDTYYKLPRRKFDSFEDWAISSGYQAGEDWYQVDTRGKQIYEITKQQGDMKTKTKSILAENYKRFFKQKLISESEYYDHDGWNSKKLNDDTGIVDALEFASQILYELNSARRGSYAVKGKWNVPPGSTVSDLIDTVQELIEQLEDVVNSLEKLED